MIARLAGIAMDHAPRRSVKPLSWLGSGSSDA